jgi:Cation efflux family
MVHIVMREIFAPYVMAWHCADEAFDHAPGRIAQKNRAKAISAICASAPSGRKVETYGSRAGGRGVGLVVLGLKFTAYWMTGSIGLYSDTLETTINVLAAGAAFVALGISAQPPDSNHPYGHHKAEYFSAAFEGTLVVAAALTIFHSAYLGFLTPKPLDAPLDGLAINAGASVLNGVWAWPATPLVWATSSRAFSSRPLSPPMASSGG